MDFINAFLPEELVYALGWTVVHSLWQGLLIAGLLGFVHLAARRHSAATRYVLGNVALTLTLVSAIGTFLYLREPARSMASSPAPVEAGLLATPTFEWTSVATPAPETANATFAQFTTYFNAHLPLIVCLWLLGVALFSLRLLGGLLYIQQLKRRGAYSMSAEWESRLKVLSERMGLRRAPALLESVRIGVPMALGHLKPVILLPIGAVNALSPEQVEAVLAHELAHIARRDYLLNVLQSIVETLFYFNPAVWWISARIRLEREHCCDDMAVAVCGNSLNYAQALVELQTLQRAAPSLAMAMGGPRRQLLSRIRRVLRQPAGEKNDGLERYAVALLFCLLLGFSTAGGALSFDEPAPERFSNEATMEADIPAPIPAAPALDTLPKEKTSLEVIRGDGRHIEASIENGKIQSLKVNGEEIAPDQYETYEAEIDAILSQSNLERHYPIMAPPTPPLPPRPPQPGVAPRPPLPPGISSLRASKVITKEGPEGKTILSIVQQGADTIEVVIDKQGNALFLQGKLLGIGDTSIIIKENIWPRGKEGARVWGWTHPEGAFRHDRLGMHIDSTLSIRLGERMRLTDSLLSRNHIRMDSIMKNIQGQVWHFDGERFDWHERLSDLAWRAQPFSRHHESFIDGGDRDSYYIHGKGMIDDRIANVLTCALLQDKLVTPKERFRLELSPTTMRINGKVQPAETCVKYLKLYEKAAKMKLEGQSRLIISKRMDCDENN